MSENELSQKLFIVLGWVLFSIDGKAFDIGGGMEQILQELYPNKSKWEI